ncbi:hypothetical protein EJB05_54245 [Eragrostis curvula]|uniref:Uncharacterized protein n=1 Tax=Eragrostis curvula TaxID=38414 RepID=A0A5J9SN13_9POAL|nr:hypothetical protein EJB05_54245 [Eragrostis curvula]
MVPSPSDTDAALRAAVDGDLRLLKELASKVDLRAVKDGNGKNVLHFAAGKGHLECCKFLVQEHGIDVNSLSAEGETPTLLAVFSGSVPVLKYILDCGGDPAMATSRGSTPLHEAAELGHCEAARLLLSKGVPVDPLNHRGTPLHLAVAKGQDGTAKVLPEHGADAGADVNFKSPSGPSALMMAVDDQLTDIVKFLLDVGADPNIADHHGRIPIMYAAGSGHRELVEILFPRTKPIPSVPNWSVDGIIGTVKYVPINAQDAVSAKEHIADAKSQGKEEFAKGEYLAAIYYYGLAMEEDPLDATLFANRSLCWLQMNEGDLALEDAQQCKVLRPNWSKAWYREGKALSLLKNYEGAADAFMEALKLDSESVEVKTALREALEAMKIEARSEEQKP